MSLLKLQNGSDIRGIAVEGVQGEAVNLTEEVVVKISRAFKLWLQEKTDKENLTIAVGRDTRISGKSLAQACIKGLKSSGITVYDFGIASTPAMFMCTVDEEIDADGAVMVTASHLPYNRNGLKFFTKEGGADSSDIKDILLKADSTDVQLSDGGKVKNYDFIDKYAKGLVEKIRKESNQVRPFEGCRIIVDAGNGAGGFFVNSVLKPLGANTEGSLYLDPDGYFPNHEPNPENKKAIRAIQDAVLANNADLGIIFDTDVDRAAVVDEKGKAINRNALIALMASLVLDDHPGTTIVTDSVTSVGLSKFIKNLGGVHHRFKRGYKNVINEAIKLNTEGVDAQLAIETSGHCALKENYFLDDGAYLVTKVLIAFAKLRKSNKTLGDLISDLDEPFESKEVRLHIDVEDFKEYAKSVLREFESFVNSKKGWELVRPNYEGIRVNCSEERGWCLMRMSLHDPVIVINIESDIRDGVKIIQNKLSEFISRFEYLKESIS